MQLNNYLNCDIPRLILIGGGLLRLKQTLQLDTWMLKLTEATIPKVVFFPTASNDYPEYIKCFNNVYQSLGCKTSIIEFTKRSYSSKELERMLSSTNLVYFGGGDPILLRQIIKQNNLIILLKKASNNGTIISGLSAGAAIFGSYFINYERKGNSLVNPSIHKGEGILNNSCIITHYTKKIKSFSKLSQTLPKNIIPIAIGNVAALYIENNKINVFKKSKYSKVGILTPNGGYRSIHKYV